MRFFTPVLLFLLSAFLVQGNAQKVDVKSRTLGNPEWNKDLTVETGKRKFDDVDHHAYIIKVYDVKPNEISSYWKGYLKDRGEKVSAKRDMVMAEQVSLTKVHQEPLDVHTSFTPEGANGVAMNVAFLHQGNALNHDENPEAHEAITELMEQLAKDLNVAVVDHQIDELQEELDDIRKALSKLQKEHENLRDDLRKNKDKLNDATHDKTDLELELESTKRRMTAMEEQGLKTEDAIKEMEKLRKDQNKAQNKIGKLEGNIMDYQQNIADVESALPVNESEQDAVHARLEEQENEIRQYRIKREAILTGKTSEELMPEPAKEDNSEVPKKNEGDSGR